MTSQVDELTRMVGMMPPELAREVLNFARFLHRKHAEGNQDWEDDVSHWGGNPDEFQTLHPFEDWDSSPDLLASRGEAA